MLVYSAVVPYLDVFNALRFKELHVVVYNFLSVAQAVPHLNKWYRRCTSSLALLHFQVMVCLSLWL
jgi:hypothetical protein